MVLKTPNETFLRITQYFRKNSEGDTCANLFPFFPSLSLLFISPAITAFPVFRYLRTSWMVRIGWKKSFSTAISYAFLTFSSMEFLKKRGSAVEWEMMKGVSDCLINCREIEKIKTEKHLCKSLGIWHFLLPCTFVKECVCPSVAPSARRSFCRLPRRSVTPSLRRVPDASNSQYWPCRFS